MRTLHLLAIAGMLISMAAWGQTTVELGAQVDTELSPAGISQAGEARTFDGIAFCWIPAGSFTMGSYPSDQPNGDPARIHDEIPHTVTISQGFWMGRYEVTQGEWTAVMGSNPSEITGDDRLPVETVNWNDCQAFIKRLNETQSGSVYRLPTETEWEYACRAGTKTPYSFGTTLSIAQANLHGGPDTTVVVGSYPPNAWNLHDMHGNVDEWCQDWRREYTEEAQTDPQGPSTGKFRNIRGGSWRSSDNFHRVSFRNGNEPTVRQASLGFRLVRNPD